MNSARTVTALLVLAAILQAAAVWAVPLVPVQDYPEWLYQGNRLARELAGSIRPDDPFQTHLVPPPPGCLAVASIAALRLVVSADASGRIVLTITLVLFVLGWRRLFSNEIRHPLRWLGLALAFNWFFLMGFLNYLLGLGLLFLALSWCRSQSELGTWSHAAILGATALLLCAAHPVGLALFLLYLLISRVSEPGRWTTGALRRVGIGLAPALTALAVAGASTVHDVELHRSALIALESWRAVLLLFPRFVLTEDPLPLTILNGIVLIVLGYLGWKVVREVAAHRPPEAVAMFGAASLLIAIVPVSRIGEFYFVNLRFLIPAAAGLAAAATLREKRFLLEALVAGIALLGSVVHLERSREFSAQAAPIVAELRSVIGEPGATLCIIRGFPEEFDKRPMQIVSGAVRPLLHARRYADLYDGIPSPRTFDTGLFVTRDDADVRDRSRLEYTIEHSASVQEAGEIIRARASVIRGGYSRAVIVGSRATREALREALRPIFPAAEERGPVLILRTSS